MKIALIDSFLEYGPLDAHRGALGGTETSFVCLAEALARRGHEVHVYLPEAGVNAWERVNYHPLREIRGSPCEVAAARWPHLFREAAAGFKRRVWWCHSWVDRELVLDAQRMRAHPILTSRFQAEELIDLGWRGGFDVVPLGCRLLDLPPPERPREPFTAVWTSAFDRGLDRLITLWRVLRPRLPQEARLVIAGGKEVYRAHGRSMEAIETRLRGETLNDRGIVWVGPLGPPEILSLLWGAGFMPYAATVAETFCLAVLEAQAAGCLPIVTPEGALPERVAHGRTGWIETLERFGERIAAYCAEASSPAVETMRRAAREAASSLSWGEAARRFERALESDFLPGEKLSEHRTNLKTGETS